MAFVVRSERNLGPNTEPNISQPPVPQLPILPTEPSQNINKNYHYSQISKSPRVSNTYRDNNESINSNLLIKSPLPGPGAYIDPAIKYNAKKIFNVNNTQPHTNSINDSSTIPSLLDQESLFISSDKRFKNTKEPIPGPGAYNIDSNIYSRIFSGKSNGEQSKRKHLLNSSIVSSELRADSGMYRNKEELNQLLKVNSMNNISNKDKHGDDKVSCSTMTEGNSDGRSKGRNGSKKSIGRIIYRHRRSDSLGDKTRVNSAFSMNNNNSIEEQRDLNNELKNFYELQGLLTKKHNVSTMSHINNMGKNDLCDFVLRNEVRVYKDNPIKVYRENSSKGRLIPIPKEIEFNDLMKIENDRYEVPGPGAYDPYKTKIPTKPVQFQSFSSSNGRFNYKIKDKNPMLIDNLEKVIDLETKQSQKFQEKTKKFVNLLQRSREIPTRAKIAKETNEKIMRKGLTKNANEYNGIISPGPCQYSPKLDIERPSSNIQNFGSYGRRFPKEDLEAKLSPGPGAYAQFYNWDKNLWKNAEKAFMKKTNEMIDRKDCTLMGISTDSPRKKKKIEEESPSCCTYNPSLVSSIEYKNYVRSLNPGEPFGSGERRFRIKGFKSKAGPGSYNLAGHLKTEPPLKDVAFGSNYRAEQRHVEELYNKILSENSPESKVGPGSYNIGSYFDWNKKSFNNLFI